MISILAPFKTAIEHRSLIGNLVRREISSRYQGSMLSWLWFVVVPLLMLAVYTFVFSIVFQARWDKGVDNKGEFALFLFSGMILFAVFSDCLNRAPSLMLENVSYIKKVIFPLEIQAWVVLLVSLFNALLSFLVLLVFYFIVRGVPPATIFLLPIVILPLSFISLGLLWFLSSLGVFLRDIKPLTGVATTVIMFLCPIFYPLSAVPPKFQAVLSLNPLTSILEQSKQLMFFGALPEAYSVILAISASWLFAWLGYLWFVKTKKGFADVV